MSNERVSKWLEGFYNYVRSINSDLIPLYSNRILFFPQDDPNVIHAGLMELDERYATEEQIKQMWELIEAYSKSHDV
jgi:hypothetical protein